ncbi:MAG TPA: spore germination protein, partial [Clostridia bacterium]|nr:spore germination protein [Clostridia bacterium]
NTKAFPTRAITEPDSEKNLSGPREGFTETMMQNLSMLRRRARTNDFKIRHMTFGRRTQTCASICYFDGVVNRRALEALLQRLEKIDIDGVLDSNYLTEIIRDHRFSLFRTIGYTERPDVVIGKLLEGRIAILLDGTPDVLTLPYLFVENFQSSEDYYLSFYYTSFSRMLRMLGFILTVMVPGLYIAVVAFHHEMLPSPLLINITAERQSVPLPAAVEAFVMLIVFDILRETGIRMPTNIGQALSIVGALVIGQAAVEAKLVAAPMIIVVAMTGITNLLVPKLNAPIIYLRLFVLLMSSMFGFFGLTISMSVILMHLLTLN